MISIFRDKFDGDTIDGDEFLHLLQNERRRMLVSLLRARDGWPLKDLTNEVAAIEQDKPFDDVHSDHRKAVYVAYYQSHLEKLEDAGIIDDDRAKNGPIYRGPTFEAAAKTLDYLYDADHIEFERAIDEPTLLEFEDDDFERDGHRGI